MCTEPSSGRLSDRPVAPLAARPVSGSRRALVGTLLSLSLLAFGPVSGGGIAPAAAQQSTFSVQPLAQPAAAPPAPAPAAKPAATPAAATPAAAKPAAGQAAQAGAEQAGAAATKQKAQTAPARPAVKAPPKVATPKPLPAVKLGAPLSKAEVFSRAAPTTMILIASHENRWGTALGVIVSPQGVVISDSRLLSGVEKGQIHGFMFDPSLSSDEDPLLYLRAHKDQAVPLTVVRLDPGSHLLMLQLPAPAPKKPYPYLDLQDTQGVNVGLDVVVLRTRGRQTLAMMTGTIAARRPDMLEVEPELSIESAGGPVLSQSGRLLGVATFSDKTVNSSGQARPVEMIRDMLAGKLGGAPAPSSVPAVMEAPAESHNAVEAVRIGLGSALGMKLEKKAALQLHSEFISAMSVRGRMVITDIESVETLNGMIRGLVKGSDPKGKVVAELFPMLLVDRKGVTWVKLGVVYRPVPGSGGGQAAIDDVTGGLYSTDSHHQLLYFDEVGTSWRISPLGGVAQIRASGGTLFVALQDGRIMAADRDGKNSRQLFPRSLKNSKLEASQGVLYVISDDGSVFRYRNKKWDQKAQPIAFAMQKLIVRGENWFGMDGAGRIFCSVVQRYIDRDGNSAGLWGVGKNLLVLTRDNNRFYYNLDSDSWGPWAHW